MAGALMRVGNMSQPVRDDKRQQLQDEVLVLGSMVEEALVRSVETLKHRDFAGSAAIIAGDRNINERRFAIEADALTLIATQQPMAGDLRTILSISNIAAETWIAALAAP